MYTVQAANVEVAAHFPTLFAAYLEKAGGKVDKFLGAPGGGGGGASGEWHNLFSVVHEFRDCV
eukprot:38660-Eustigmatos_ZCMA.PRE.1